MIGAPDPGRTREDHEIAFAALRFGVAEVIHRDEEPPPRDVTIEAAKQRFEHENTTSWPVDDPGYVQGVVSSHQIDTAIRSRVRS